MVFYDVNIDRNRERERDTKLPISMILKGKNVLKAKCSGTEKAVFKKETVIYLKLIVRN